jgi:glyoxylase-like metal-dependent hydrolase (beta-lactamase superfamily II)
MANAAAKAKISVQPLRRNITVLEGSGGNIAVLTGRNGKLLADPIKHLVNTHCHTDHTDCIAWLHSAGAATTAHESTRQRLSVATLVAGWDYPFPAALGGALPVKGFATGHEIRGNASKTIIIPGRLTIFDSSRQVFKERTLCRQLQPKMAH